MKEIRRIKVKNAKGILITPKHPFIQSLLLIVVATSLCSNSHCLWVLTLLRLSRVMLLASAGLEVLSSYLR